MTDEEFAAVAAGWARYIEATRAEWERAMSALSTALAGAAGSIAEFYEALLRGLSATDRERLSRDPGEDWRARYGPWVADVQASLETGGAWIAPEGSHRAH